MAVWKIRLDERGQAAYGLPEFIYMDTETGDMFIDEDDPSTRQYLAAHTWQPRDDPPGSVDEPLEP